MTMLVSGATTRAPPAPSTPSASSRAAAWSSPSRPRWCSSPWRAAAARMPLCRIPPPKRLRARWARAMKARVPASAAPTGAPSPFEKDTITESAQAAKASRGVPVAALAFQSRAPSRCTGHPRVCASRASACSSGSGVTTPPAPLWVFSRHTSDVSGACTDGWRMAASRSAARIAPAAGCTSRGWSPASTAAPAISQCTMCASASTSSSLPGTPCTQSAAWLAIVPVGKKSAASVPSRSATAASSRRVVGSPSSTSSPTSAAAMACRMAGVGRVTVSLRRSRRGSVMDGARRKTGRGETRQGRPAPRPRGGAAPPPAPPPRPRGRGTPRSRSRTPRR